MESSEPSGLLHERLVERGPELLVAVGLVLIGLGVGLDREWLAALGVITLMLGVVLPRVRGALTAGPAGLEFAEIIGGSELRASLKAKGKDLPSEALERAEYRAASLRHAARTLPAVAWTQYVDVLAEGLLSETARKEWRVTFVGPLSDEARNALDQADDMILVSGHTVGGVESHSAIVNAATPTEAVNRLRSRLEGTGSFHRWEAKEFPGAGFFGPRQDDGEDGDQDQDSQTR